MAHYQSFILSPARHPKPESGMAGIPLYLQIFGRPDTRRRVGERPADMMPLEVGDGLRIGGRVFDNRRRVSIRRLGVGPEAHWLLEAMPEGKDASQDRVAMAARTTWLREIGVG